MLSLLPTYPKCAAAHQSGHRDSIQCRQLKLSTQLPYTEHLQVQHDSRYTEGNQRPVSCCQEASIQGGAGEEECPRMGGRGFRERAPAAQLCHDAASPSLHPASTLYSLLNYFTRGLIQLSFFMSSVYVKCTFIH